MPGTGELRFTCYLCLSQILKLHLYLPDPLLMTRCLLALPHMTLSRLCFEPQEPPQRPGKKHGGRYGLYALLNDRFAMH